MVKPLQEYFLERPRFRRNTVLMQFSPGRLAGRCRTGNFQLK
ncbi:MAG: hypothetical protein DKINENOH_05427 [bacterium]|nr:hypothetical protein [bacterium]